MAEAAKKKVTLEDCDNDPGLIADLSEKEAKALSEEANNRVGFPHTARALAYKVAEFAPAETESSDGD